MGIMMWLIIGIAAVCAAGAAWRFRKSRQRRQRHAELHARRAEADRLWYESLEKNRDRASGDA